MGDGCLKFPECPLIDLDELDLRFIERPTSPTIIRPTSSKINLHCRTYFTLRFDAYRNDLHNGSEITVSPSAVVGCQKLRAMPMRRLWSSLDTITFNPTSIATIVDITSSINQDK